MSFYADLDLDFLMHPMNSDISRKYDEQAIARSIKNLILTNKYERLFNVDVYGGISALLFEPADIVTLHTLEGKIKSVINRYEPRVKDVSVECYINSSGDGVDTTIFFTPINNRIPTQITLYLKRVR
jgi:phage baseplate assembly protein W